MIAAARMLAMSASLAARSGPSPPQAWDLRIDASELADDSQLWHSKQQALLRAYQARYVLLPQSGPTQGLLERLRHHYDPQQMSELEALRWPLEAELIVPRLESARAIAAGQDFEGYLQTLLPSLRNAPENPFIHYLRGSPQRAAHYRNFLLQSSADLLAEASASALGVIGEFGPAQSALFRILLDEFGHGIHERKHSVLYRTTMRDFGLCDSYNGYWPWFDTVTLELHNTIHFLFQNPRNIFLQVGFLLFAETAYQRSTADHWRYLREFHPNSDARYFAEHAHIDLHHTRMVIEEVAAPLIAAHGKEVAAEFIAGAELTRRVFADAERQQLAVCAAFDLAVAQGKAWTALPNLLQMGAGLTPASAAQHGGTLPVQVGAIGMLADAQVFANFPVGTYGRTQPRDTAATQ